MFREMRRKKQALAQAECLRILEKSSAGTLACLGDGGYPYAVPLSFVYVDGTIYFHCAKSGHKLDAIMTYPKVSFCIIDQDEIVGSEYTTYFRSVIAFGTAHVAKDESWRKGMHALIEKYSPEQPEADKLHQLEHCEQSLIIAIDVEHLSGKEAIELVRK